MAKCNLGKVTPKQCSPRGCRKLVLQLQQQSGHYMTPTHSCCCTRAPKLRGRPSSSQGHLVTPSRSLVLTRVTFAAGLRAPKAWGGPCSSRGTWCPLHAVWCLHESVSLAVTLASSQFFALPTRPWVGSSFVWLVSIPLSPSV